MIAPFLYIRYLSILESGDTVEYSTAFENNGRLLSLESSVIILWITTSYRPLK